MLHPSAVRKGVALRHLTLIATFVLLGAVLHAQQPPPRDYDVKAAYLFNFGRFTTWPAAGAGGDGAVFGVCVLGRDPFGAALDGMVTGEMIDGKRVTVRRIARAADTEGCRILFVSASEDAELAHILQTLVGSRILTVSDLPQFVERGGMIQFVSDGKKIRFTVNVPAATQAGLMLSSELLRVAAAVRANARPGGA
jgi:hypothetical protein